MDYEKLTNEELVKLYQENDERAFEFLVKQNAKIINKLTRCNFSLDYDELVQVAYIELERAARNYKEEYAKFITYAYKCIKLRIVGEMKEQLKEQELQSLNSQISDLENSLLSSYSYFEDDFIQDESFNELKLKIQTVLSKFEIEVFDRYFIKGWSYKEITQDLKVSSKKVENAIQRIKIKVKKLMEK